MSTKTMKLDKVQLTPQKINAKFWFMNDYSKFDK